jgi:hypothetical protein
VTTYTINTKIVISTLMILCCIVIGALGFFFGIYGLCFLAICILVPSIYLLTYTKKLSLRISIGFLALFSGCFLMPFALANQSETSFVVMFAAFLLSVCLFTTAKKISE